MQKESFGSKDDHEDSKYYNVEYESVEINQKITAVATFENRNTLIEIYHLYLIHEHEMLPANFEEMANHLLFLLDFLKLADKEMNAVGEREFKE